jgi:hypothetical protein
MEYSQKNYAKHQKIKYHTRGASIDIQVSPATALTITPTFTVQKSVRVGPNLKLCYLKKLKLNKK